MSFIKQPYKCKVLCKDGRVLYTRHVSVKVDQNTKGYSKITILGEKKTLRYSPLLRVKGSRDSMQLKHIYLQTAWHTKYVDL